MNNMEARCHISNMVTTSAKKISSFSSFTLSSILDNMESTFDDLLLKKHVDTQYSVEYQVELFSDMYLDYLDFLRRSPTPLRIDKIMFFTYLYAYAFETIASIDTEIMSRDSSAPEKEMSKEEALSLAEKIMHVFESNQYINMYALRNGKERFDEQSQFIEEEVANFILMSRVQIAKLENFNNSTLAGEFLGWMNDFPVRLFNYMYSLNNYEMIEADWLGDTHTLERIFNELENILHDATMLTVTVKEVK